MHLRLGISPPSRHKDSEKSANENSFRKKFVEKVANLTKSIQTSLFSNPLEFEGVKIWVVKSLPYTKKFHGIAVTHPVSYNSVGVCGIFLPSDFGTNIFGNKQLS